MSSTFDYIICGGGFSGLTQAFFLSKYQPDKTILIIEPKASSLSNKTFSFWRKDSEVSDFESIVFKKWKRINFKFKGANRISVLDDYSYCTILGTDYEKFIKDALKLDNNVSWLNDRVIEFHEEDNYVKVWTQSSIYSCSYVFNSIYEVPKVNRKQHFLTQNYGGYVIETDEDVFDTSSCTMFDFTVNNGWNFYYVLPYSSRSALVENISLNHTSEEGINEYIKKNLGIQNYKVTYKEGGNTPLTDINFSKWDGKRIFNIGIQGGMIKPTTGFAFHRVQTECKSLALNLNNVKKHKTGLIYKLADSLVLHTMDKRPQVIQNIFQTMFMKADTDLLFAFLDEDISFIKMMKICVKILPILKYLFVAFLEDIFL